MGYTTSFDGNFSIQPALNDDDRVFLHRLSASRRVAWRDKGNKYGTDGEWYTGGGPNPASNDPGIVDYNSPPAKQPGLWCHWEPNATGTKLQWDGGEKFYDYVAWLKYLIDKYLAPRGYVLNGVCYWAGEEDEDKGKIVVKDNKVLVAVSQAVTYGTLEEV